MPADAVGEDTASMQPRFYSVLLDERDAAVGKTLDEVNLADLDVEVNSVRRHNVRGSEPAGDMVMRTGDVLVLLGQPMPLMAAEKRLREGE